MFDITTYILAREYAATVVTKKAGAEVEVVSASGKIDEDSLQKLMASNASFITLDKKVYRLSRIEGEVRKYLNTCTDGDHRVVKMTELNLNSSTGDFHTKILINDHEEVEQLREELRVHEDNSSIHVAESDRNNWNSKVSAEAQQVGLGPDYCLNLIR